jgi:hypothetical protein
MKDREDAILYGYDFCPIFFQDIESAALFHHIFLLKAGIVFTFAQFGPGSK